MKQLFIAAAVIVFCSPFNAQAFIGFEDERMNCAGIRANELYSKDLKIEVVQKQQQMALDKVKKMVREKGMITAKLTVERDAFDLYMKAVDVAQIYVAQQDAELVQVCHYFDTYKKVGSKVPNDSPEIVEKCKKLRENIRTKTGSILFEELSEKDKQIIFANSTKVTMAASRESIRLVENYTQCTKPARDPSEWLYQKKVASCYCDEIKRAANGDKTKKFWTESEKASWDINKVYPSCHLILGPPERNREAYENALKRRQKMLKELEDDTLVSGNPNLNYFSEVFTCVDKDQNGVITKQYLPSFLY